MGSDLTPAEKIDIGHEEVKAQQGKQAARKEGLQTLLQSALNKVREGVTTLDEAFSVCATQSEMFEL